MSLYIFEKCFPQGHNRPWIYVKGCLATLEFLLTSNAQCKLAYKCTFFLDIINMVEMNINKESLERLFQIYFLNVSIIDYIKAQFSKM